MTVEAIAVDIDGTITNEKRQICISAIEALRKAEKAGIPTIIVTGNVVNYAYAAEVLIGCSGGLIAENGGIVFKEGENNNAVETLVERDFVTSAENHLKERIITARIERVAHWVKAISTIISPPSPNGREGAAIAAGVRSNKPISTKFEQSFRKDLC